MAPRHGKTAGAKAPKVTLKTLAADVLVVAKGVAELQHFVANPRYIYKESDMGGEKSDRFPPPSAGMAPRAVAPNVSNAPVKMSLSETYSDSLRILGKINAFKETLFSSKEGATAATLDVPPPHDIHELIGANHRILRAIEDGLDTIRDHF